MDASTRAKQILDLCHYELQNTEIWAQDNLVLAVTNLVRDAYEQGRKDQLKQNKEVELQERFFKNDSKPASTRKR